MYFQRLFSFLILIFLASDVFAVNWGKAMHMYYQDFNPYREMLYTLGLIVSFGVGVYIYQRYKKKKAEKKKQNRTKNDEFNDFL